MKKALNSIILKVAGGLILASVLVAGAAIVKVEVLGERVKTHRELLKEIKRDVKSILGVINETKLCAEKQCRR